MRPQTYESVEEAEILSYVFAGRGGLENTAFALLSPEGKKLTRGSRSPSMTFGEVPAFVAALGETATRFEAKAEPIEALPTLRDLRLALNVAAADMRPLVVVRGEGEEATRALAKKVAALAWSDALVGTSHYVLLDEAVEFEGLAPELGVSLVRPDPYGQGGELLAHFEPSATGEAGSKLSAELGKLVAEYSVEAREHDDHVREARRRGIEWETVLPVSDPHGRGGGGRGGRGGR